MNPFLSKKFRKDHVIRLKSCAGQRYTPELHVDLPVARLFRGLSRTEAFYVEIRTHYGELSRKFKDVSHRFETSIAQSDYKIFRSEIHHLMASFERIKEYNTRRISWRWINRRAKRSLNSAWTLIESVRGERDKQKLQRSSDAQEDARHIVEKLEADLHYLHKVIDELMFFEDFSSSTEAKLSNTPFLLITGSAGKGKTHLLCDVIESRIKEDKVNPALIVFGEHFVGQDDPVSQILSQLKFKMSRKRFLMLLDNAGKKTGCRALLVVDALNETRLRHFWKKNLGKLVGEIRDYPNIALVVSFRTGYESEVVSQSVKRKFVSVEHHGFDSVEWEAVTKFFEGYQVPFPEIPLLLPEFQTPLFLMLYCVAFGRKNRDLSEKNTSQIKRIKPIKGHVGATHIFEAFVKQAASTVATKLSLPKGRSGSGKFVIWDDLIKKFTEKMVEENDDRVGESDLFQLASEVYPNIEPEKLVTELERNFLVVKVPRYSTEGKEVDGHDYRLPFQKFSDHLIGRYIFKSYEREFGKSNGDLVTAKRFFSRRRRLGKFIATTWNYGIIEALFIQCPEYFAGLELVDVAPYLRNSHHIEGAFLQSLIWRRPTAFSDDLRSALTYINSAIVTTEQGHTDLLNAFLSVAPIKDHPFNADFLHRHLSKPKMAKRDIWWSSTFLHYQFGEKNAVDRLLEWSLSNQDKSHITDEAMRLCCVPLCWFLSTPNRFLRDRATKALVNLLTGRLTVVLELLKQFKGVDDPYITERMFAVAYGCVMRSRDDLKALEELALWIYDEIFKNGDPTAHILIRDYSRGVVELALMESSRISINIGNIVPPFRSEWSKRVPTEEALKKKYMTRDPSGGGGSGRGYRDIWSSVMYDFGTMGDFGRYVLNNSLERWSGRKLKDQKSNPKLSFEEFKDSLSESQLDLLENVTNPREGVDFSTLIASLDWSEPNGSADLDLAIDEIKEKRSSSLDEFEACLTEDQKKCFNEKIKPYMDDRCRIIDPKEHFDTARAQRWIFRRVIQLGWKPELHGKFDESVNHHRIDRSANKPERIGKKYQWIALHELLARVSDNFVFKQDSWSGEMDKFDGSWQLSIRDIDPSWVRVQGDRRISEDTPTFPRKIRKIYTAWDKRYSGPDWIKHTRDLPDPKLLLELDDENGVEWIVLGGFVDWKQEHPPEVEKYQLPTRTVSYFIRSCLVRSKDLNNVAKWAAKQKRWMPESGELDYVFMGEYPWAPAYICQTGEEYDRDKWINRANFRDIPGELLLTDDSYYISGSSFDCSIDESINVRLPSKFIIDKLGLAQKSMDGRFYDKKGALTALDIGIWDDDKAGFLAIKKRAICNFLKRNSLSLIWSVSGEKKILQSRPSSSDLGWREMKGIYTLGSDGLIRGNRRSYYRKVESRKTRKN